MQVVNTKVHGQQTMAFPSVEERMARRNQYLDSGKFVGNTNELAKAAAAAIHPQTQGASVTMHSEEMPVAPSPRVQRQQAAHNQGSIQNPRPGPTVDPSLVAAMQGRPPGTGSTQPQVQPQPQQPMMRRPQPVQEYEQRETEWHEPPRPRPMAADVAEQGVRNPMPGYVVPIADSGGSSVALPSRFAYYGFKDLYVVPFKNAHLAKLQRAASEKSLQPVVEAVATVVYSSDPQFKNLAFDLTVPDFFFVLYWLRMNSFTKMSFIHKDICRNPDHLKKVESKELTEESLLLKAIIDKTMLKTHELEYIPNPDLYTLPKESPFYIGPPTMRDLLEFLDHPMMQNPNTRVEFAYLAQKVSHLHGKDGYVSIDQRIEWYENEDPDLAVMLDDFRTATKNYGVEEFIHMNCKVCGASRKSNIVLDASSFLSSDRR